MNRLYQPRYWPFWLGLLALRLLMPLPYRLQLRAGRFLGRLFMRFSHKARHITEVNLNLCFPELNPHKREELLRKNFESAGMGLVEAALAWWGNAEKLQPLLHVHGLDHITSALKQGKGIILCSAHFSTLELTGRLLAKQLTFSAMYRPQKNPVLNYIIHKYRSRFYQHLIAREDLRRFIQYLKENKIVWYTPDVDGGARNSVFVPFFGINTASLTMTARLATITKAALVPIVAYRRDDETGYDIHIGPCVDNFPCEDVEQDTLRINQILETAIRRKPEQYLWQYKRFKTRPAGEKRFYKL